MVKPFPLNNHLLQFTFGEEQLSWIYINALKECANLIEHSCFGNVMQMLIPEQMEMVEPTMVESTMVESTSESLEGMIMPSEDNFSMMSDEQQLNLEFEELEDSQNLEGTEQGLPSTMQPLVFEGLKNISRVNLVGVPMIYRRGSNFRMGKTLNKGPRFLKVSTMGLKTRKHMSSEDTYVLAPVLMSQEVYEALFDQPDTQFEQINQIVFDKISD